MLEIAVVQTERSDVQSSSQITTTRIPTEFLRAGCLSCHPTNSVKALKVGITFNDLE